MPFKDADKQREYMKLWFEANRDKHNEMCLKRNKKQYLLKIDERRNYQREYSHKKYALLKEFKRLSNILLN